MSSTNSIPPVKVANISNVSQNVDIVGPDNAVQTVTIVPKARPTLPQGYQVSPNWLARNPRVVKIIEARPAVPVPAIPAVQPPADKKGEE